MRHSPLLALVAVLALSCSGGAATDSDSGPVATDSGLADAGLPDAGVDGGPTDGGLPDAGQKDGGDVDAGPADAGPTEADGGPADAGVVCQSGELRCVDGCADPMTNPLHCGDCETSCGEGGACVSGGCVCAGTSLVCDESCVDGLSNDDHCGSCEQRCILGEHCVEGTCRLGLPEAAMCDGALHDLALDDAHCGACDHACAAPEACVSGNCCIDCNLLRGATNGQALQGNARIVEIAAGGTSTVFEPQLDGPCGANWSPSGSLCDEGITRPFEYVREVSTKSNTNAGANWTTNNGPDDVGILVLDFGVARSIGLLSVFQMFSDGKVTDIRVFGHAETGATPPLAADVQWQAWSDVTPVGPGLLMTPPTDAWSLVGAPTKVLIEPARTTRYLKLVLRNDGSLGDPNHIELREVKAFAGCHDEQCRCSDGALLCDGTCVDVHWSHQNCGACNHACGDEEACVNGTCGGR